MLLPPVFFFFFFCPLTVPNGYMAMLLAKGVVVIPIEEAHPTIPGCSQTAELPWLDQVRLPGRLAIKLDMAGSHRRRATICTVHSVGRWTYVPLLSDWVVRHVTSDTVWKMSMNSGILQWLLLCVRRLIPTKKPYKAKEGRGHGKKYIYVSSEIETPVCGTQSGITRVFGVTGCVESHIYVT